jgi:hypothetical protein
MNLIDRLELQFPVKFKETAKAKKKTSPRVDLLRVVMRALSGEESNHIYQAYESGDYDAFCKGWDSMEERVKLIVKNKMDRGEHE